MVLDVNLNFLVMLLLKMCTLRVINVKFEWH
jgi:hypothetical protein